MTQDTTKGNFSRLFYFLVPWAVPVIVTLATYVFYPITKAFNLVWVPLIFIYWGTIWSFTMLYRKMKGGVFSRERFKPTLRLKGPRLWLQYILVYGPFTYAIPLFIINYASNPAISPLMYVVILLASIINGPSEEIYWRACLDDAGRDAGISEKTRFIYSPVVFALWHTAFVIHLYPWTPAWWVTWATFMLMTWSSGLIWTWVLHKSGRLFPQIFYHSCSNFLSVFPLLLVTVLGFYF